MFVYVITNKINGKRYIGKTIGTLKSRWRVHKCCAKTRPTVPINFAIRKYGPNNFTMGALSTHDNLEDLNKAEIAAIKKWKTEDKKLGYNRTPGGDGAPLGNCYMRGHRHSEEARLKMSASHTGLIRGPMNPEWRGKISKALMGIIRGPKSEEHSRKIREHNEHVSNEKCKKACDWIRDHNKLPGERAEKEERQHYIWLRNRQRAYIGKEGRSFYESDQKIAELNGFPALFKMWDLEKNSNEKCKKVCEWIRKHGGKKSNKRSNDLEEKSYSMWVGIRRMAYSKRGHWSFYESDQEIAESYGYTGLFKDKRKKGPEPVSLCSALFSDGTTHCFVIEEDS